MRISDWSSDVCSSDLRCCPRLPFLRRSRRCGHLGIEVEQLFQPLGIVAKPPPDIDAFQHLVVALMGFAQIGGHLFGVIKVGDSGRKMRLARQQDILLTTGKIIPLFLGSIWKWKSLPSHFVAVTRSAERRLGNEVCITVRYRRWPYL